MLCAIAKMAVLGAFGTEKVIFPYRIVGLVRFYLFPYMVTCKMAGHLILSINGKCVFTQK